MTDAACSPITVSIVSHGQGGMVSALLDDLSRCAAVGRVLVTQNIPEPEIACPPSLRSRLVLIRNERPLGFGANHNQAFRQCATPFFAAVNPDIRIEQDPFPPLLDTLVAGGCGLAAPAVRNPDGGLEDSARHFPTPLALLAKLLKLGDGRYPVTGGVPMPVDWTAGMFMVFPAEVFRRLGGFDEGFFLYYEDVDICVRSWRAGCRVMLHPGAAVIHAAQRASRRNPRYMAWHFSSMARYFGKHLGRLPRTGVQP